jgi:hypothetical protein
MGNSEAMVLKHYWNWETLGNDAEAFWAISPPGERAVKELSDS